MRWYEWLILAPVLPAVLAFMGMVARVAWACLRHGWRFPEAIKEDREKLLRDLNPQRRER